MSDKDAIQMLCQILKHKAHWFIDTHCADVDEFKQVAEKAKLKADETLPSLSSNQLYSRYKLWRKVDPIIDFDCNYFDNFLNDVLFDLGRKSLRGRERQWFEDNCRLTIHFL